MLRLEGAEGEEFVVRWVIQRTAGSAWLEIEKAEGEKEREKEDREELEAARSGAKAPMLWAPAGSAGSRALSKRIGEIATASNLEGGKSGESSVPGPTIIWAVADPGEKWWARVRGNPKRSGEISQAAFLLRAEMMGYDLALPWGDNQAWDFVVWARDGKAVRVQVKGTGRLHRRGYEVQPVRTGRGGRKKRYTKKDIDVIAAHVQPVDAWYLIPIEEVGRAKSLRLYPGIESRHPRWERYRDGWGVLG